MDLISFYSVIAVRTNLGSAKIGKTLEMVKKFQICFSKVLLNILLRRKKKINCFFLIKNCFN